MPRKSAASSSPSKRAGAPPVDADAVVESLKDLGTKATREGMARYAIPSDKAFGVPVGTLKKEAKRLGRSHELAEGLWASGWYEARMLAVFVDEPDRVTAAQMERWCRDFDNWAICDTACFHLFDRTPHAWDKVATWSRSPKEFVKRTGFALLWSLSLHDKKAEDARFLEALAHIEREAEDDRNFVTKAIQMALRAVGKRNAALRAAALRLARKLADSAQPAARRVGKDALRELA